MDRSSQLLCVVAASLVSFATLAQPAGQQSILAPPPLRDWSIIGPPDIRESEHLLSHRRQASLQGVELQDAGLGSAAERVAQLIDAGRAGEVWDGASIVARATVARPDFVESIKAERARAGALVSRGKAHVVRVNQPAGSKIPEGLYVNVTFESRFKGSQQPIQELVSFRLDEDSVLRLAGYALTSSAG